MSPETKEKLRKAQTKYFQDNLDARVAAVQYAKLVIHYQTPDEKQSESSWRVTIMQRE